MNTFYQPSKYRVYLIVEMKYRVYLIEETKILRYLWKSLNCFLFNLFRELKEFYQLKIIKKEKSPLF